MIRITLKPDNTDIHLSVPENYAGRKPQVMLYPVDELFEVSSSGKTVKKRPSDFAGTLSKEEGQKFRRYLKQARDEWDRG